MGQSCSNSPSTDSPAASACAVGLVGMAGACGTRSAGVGAGVGDEGVCLLRGIRVAALVAGC